MNKKQLLTLGLVSVGIIAFMGKKKDGYSKEDLDKIEKYKKYLDDKNFTVLTKKEYNKIKKNKRSLFSLSNIHSYYSIAKSLARYVV